MNLWNNGGEAIENGSKWHINFENRRGEVPKLCQNINKHIVSSNALWIMNWLHGHYQPRNCHCVTTTSNHQTIQPIHPSWRNSLSLIVQKVTIPLADTFFRYSKNSSKSFGVCRLRLLDSNYDTEKIGKRQREGLCGFTLLFLSSKNTIFYCLSY